MPCVPTATSSSRTRKYFPPCATVSKQRWRERLLPTHSRPNPAHAPELPIGLRLIKTGQYADLAQGIRLHYASSGMPGQPLVLCVHGFPEYWGAWQDVLPLLGEWSCAVAPDWGGAAGWQIAISRPQLVRKLVILNSPHPFTFARELAHNPEQQRASGYMNRLRAADAEEQLSRNDFDRLFASFDSREGEPARWLDAGRRERYRAVWTRGLTGALNYYRATPLYPPTADDPGASALTLDAAKFMVQVPTLVLWGMRDRALLPCLLDGLEELVPQITVERLPAASHWLAHEEPTRVAERVRGFLQS